MGHKQTGMELGMGVKTDKWSRFVSPGFPQLVALVEACLQWRTYL